MMLSKLDSDVDAGNTEYAYVIFGLALSTHYRPWSPKTDLMISG